MRRSFWHAGAALLRSARLLGVADSALFVRSVLKEQKSNRAFRASHPNFPLSPAHLAFDAYGNTNHAAYMESGTIHARVIGELVNRRLAGDEIRVCEWGCGPGRVIRYLRSYLRHSRVALYGTDYNAEPVSWCRANLVGIAFFRNGLAPSLPVEGA